MKKSILTFIALLLAGVNTAWADDVAENYDTSVKYATLQEAFAAVATGQKINLLTNVTLAEPLNLELAGKEVRLDLGRYTLTGRTNLKSGKLIIQNGNIAGGSEQALNVYGSATAGAENYSVLSIADDVKVTADVYGVCLFGPTYNAAAGYGAVIDIAGSVSTTGDGKNGAVFVSGNLGKNITGDMKNVITILGNASITSVNDAAIALNGNATVSIESEDVTITGNTAIAIKRGTLNVTGGTIHSTGAEINPPSQYNNGTEMTGAGISMTSSYNQYGDMAVNISGGTVTSDHSVALFKYEYTNKPYTNDATYAVSGGTFSSSVPAEFLASGILIGQNPNGSYSVVAEADAVASIDDTKYATLAAAFAAVETGGTIKLLDDVTLSSALDISLAGKTVTLDLNTKTLTGRTNLKSGNLTIKNGTVAGGAEQALNVYGSATSTTNYSVLTINSDVTVTADVYGVCLFGPTYSSKPGYGAVINIAGTVTTTGDSKNGAVFVSGNLGNNISGDMNNIINITGKVTSSTDAAVALNGNATVNILEGSEITGYTAIAVKRGVLNVEGGTIHATGAEINPPSQYNNGTEMTGAGISMTSSYNQYGDMAVNITGGTVTSDHSVALYKYEYTNKPYTNAATYAVSGGTFSSPVPEEFCADDYLPVKTVDGFGVTQDDYVAEIGTDKFVSLADAFGSVLEGDTIKLLKDVELTKNIYGGRLDRGQAIYMQFGDYTVTKGSYSINLTSTAADARSAEPAANVGGVIVYTDKLTDIFDAADEGEILLVGSTNDANFPYYYQVVSETPDEAIARNEQTGMLFSDLQVAVDLAEAGQTVTVLKDVALATTVNVNKWIIIEGGHHTITAADFKPALKVTGTGDVTINKTKIDTYYENVDVNGYTDGGIAILADDGYSGKLTVDYCHLVTSNRGIDIQKVGAGFSLDVKNDTITGKRADVTDPKTQYINSFNFDPYQTARGINFSNATVALNAKVENTLIQGLAYALNISNTGSQVKLDVLDCTFYGRGGVNVHGSSNVVNLDHITVNGLNNQLGGKTETFACIVEDSVAKYNDYNLKDVRAKATVLAGQEHETNATEMFIDLRGSDATVKIKGNSGYDIDAEDRDRVGFMNDAEMQRLLDPSANNRIFFDDQSKEYFTYWFEKITPWPNAFDAQNRNVRLDIKDELDAIIGLHQVVPIYPVVQVTIDTEDPSDPNNVIPLDFYYDSLAKAINGEFFENGAYVIILDNITMDEDITPDLKRGDFFTLMDDNNNTRTITPGDYKIYLNPLVTVFCDFANGASLFAPSDTVNTTVLKQVETDDLGGTTTSYTAANVYWANDVNDIPAWGQYYLFDELFTNDDEAMIAIWPETYTRLEMNLKLERDLKFPDAIDDDSDTSDPSRKMADENNGNRYWIDFSTFKIDKGDYSIALEVGDTVYTTVTTDIFSSANPAYYVTYDAVDSTKVKENGDNVSFKYRYYLMKDGLAVTVDPATFCGDRLTPTFQVKKKDPATDTWKVVNGITKADYDALVSSANPDLTGIDYYWYLVPPVSADDDSTYVSAKTYHGALVIEGITFQGTRKADFTILPRDIKDVVVKDSTNILKWRAEGYTPAQIADTLLLVYNCLTHNSDTLLTKYNATTKKGDYLISVADGPEAGGKYLEVDTYSQVITVTAVEGGNYTGSLKLDFTILQDGLIDISKCMVVSDATYTSDPLPPLKSRLKVILKDPATGTETVVDSAAYTLEVHGAPESYINAQTYSNAITIKGKSSYVPSGSPDGTPAVKGYYGSLDADYVIKQRDLADSLDVKDENDNQGKVILEAYAGADKPATTPATIYLKWTGKELVPVINGTTDNNINLILKAKEDSVPNVTPGDVEWKLIPADYSYTIEPAPMVDPGIYKVIFTGRGNFTGMREVNVMVLKDINELADNIKMPYQIIPDNLALTPSQMKGIEVKDGNKVLVENEEYTLVIKGGKPGQIFDETTPIYVKGKYYAYFYGKEPYYTGQYVDDFRAFFEYIGWDTNPVAGTGTNIYNNPTSIAKKPDTNGNIIASSGLQYDGTNTTPVSVRITDVSDSLNLKAEITYIDNINDGTVTACDPTKEIVKVKPTFQIAAGLDNGAARYFTFNIVGVQDNAFKNLPRIHCLDLTQIEGYTPDNLTRSEDGPFNYYPVQSLVYFDGTQGADITGTNYIYKKGTDDFRCEELKIYDDIKGDQQGFETDADYIGGGHGWEFRNIYQFVADKVTNTRVFTAGQHYTTCLPYKLQMSSNLKAYTLDAASDNIFGFKQYTANELDQFTPYVLIPSKGGNLLNNAESTVCYVTPTVNRGFMPLDENNNRRYDFATPTGHIMYGSTIYMGWTSPYPVIFDLYIMQSKNMWKRIPFERSSTYNKACILPMRAYIMLPTHPQNKINPPSYTTEQIEGFITAKSYGNGSSREYIRAEYTDVDGVAEVNIDANDDWTNAEVYDLQGRKVDTTKSTMRKGVYIVNGQKRIRK